MGEWRCGTCHKLILGPGDAQWHTKVLGHDPPYDNEPGED